jgi:hypothetical protein
VDHCIQTVARSLRTLAYRLDASLVPLSPQGVFPSYALRPQLTAGTSVPLAGSWFKLTLSGFDATPSDCRASYGHAVLAVGEECGDGADDGECSAGRMPGGFLWRRRRQWTGGM